VRKLDPYRALKWFGIGGNVGLKESKVYKHQRWPRRGGYEAEADVRDNEVEVGCERREVRYDTRVTYGGGRLPTRVPA